MTLSAAISKYIYIAINHTFTDDYFIKYAQLERVDQIRDIQHPIIREALRLVEVGRGIEIVSIADIPAGTGLGSSGAFAVGLLHALHAYKRDHVLPQLVAEEACHIEIDVLGRPVGKQDQYIAAFGGINCFEFERDGKVRASALKISTDVLHQLEEHLLLFFVGFARDSDAVLEDQDRRSVDGDIEMLENLQAVKDLGYAAKQALERGDTSEFAKTMHQHWLLKKERSIAVSNAKIDRCYEIARKNGALGGKLVGEGGGGFLLLYAENKDAVRQALNSEGLAEVFFTFDQDGSAVIGRS